MTNHQTFTDPGAGTWQKIDILPGVESCRPPSRYPTGPSTARGSAKARPSPSTPTQLTNSCSCCRARSKPAAGAVKPAHSGRRPLALAKARTSPSPKSSCLPSGLGPWGRSATVDDDHHHSPVLALAAPMAGAATGAPNRAERSATASRADATISGRPDGRKGNRAGFICQRLPG